VNVKKALEYENSIYHYYKKLISIRKQNEIFVYGDCELLYTEDERIFSYIRNSKSEKLYVILNFYGNTTDFIVPEEIRYGKAELIISNYEARNQLTENISLQPYEAIVYRSA
jgi:oligo-1,6-glucosidase